MSRRRRRSFTAAQRKEIWDRYQRGESLTGIGRVFGKFSSQVYEQLVPYGGIRPAPRCRSRLALTLVEREEISRGIVAQRSIRAMARSLGRSASTVSREIGRNGGYDVYRAAPADERAWAQAKRPKRCKLACYPRLARTVARKLKIELVAGADRGLAQACVPPRRVVSGVTRDDLSQPVCTSARRTEERVAAAAAFQAHDPPHATLKGKGLGQITGLVSIRERPASVEDRAVPGHWEGDLLKGSKNSYIATLVERQTRYVMLAKVPSMATYGVINALCRADSKRAKPNCLIGRERATGETSLARVRLPRQTGN